MLLTHSLFPLVVGIDIQDDLGRHDVGFIENTQKTPWNNGKGCIFESRFHINRVPGRYFFIKICNMNKLNSYT